MSLEQAMTLTSGKREFTTRVNNRSRKTRRTDACYFAAPPNRSPRASHAKNGGRGRATGFAWCASLWLTDGAHNRKSNLWRVLAFAAGGEPGASWRCALTRCGGFVIQLVSLNEPMVRCGSDSLRSGRIRKRNPRCYDDIEGVCPNE